MLLFCNMIYIYNSFWQHLKRQQNVKYWLSHINYSLLWYYIHCHIVDNYRHHSLTHTTYISYKQQKLNSRKETYFEVMKLKVLKHIRFRFCFLHVYVCVCTAVAQVWVESASQRTAMSGWDWTLVLTCWVCQLPRIFSSSSLPSPSKCLWEKVKANTESQGFMFRLYKNNKSVMISAS